LSSGDALTGEIRSGLQLIRSRQRWMAWLLLGFLPLVFLPLGLAPFFPDWEAPFIVVMLLYGGLLLVFSLRLALTDCPRCDRFYHLSWWANPFTQRCLNCGLRLATLREER
jgi:hypothetical protein